MSKIISLTVNPTIDKNATVEAIKPNSKLRCSSPSYYPGGGGINVSRALKRLGGSSLAWYLAGGPTGDHLHNLLDMESIEQKAIEIKGWTRENFSVTEKNTGQQYRFGMPGPSVAKEEWKSVLEKLESELTEGDFLVGSGSLAPDIPENFYAQLAALAKEKKTKFILDTSGKPLVEGAKEGVYLLKPNLGELGALCGVESISVLELEELGREVIEKNYCEILVISLGPGGAMLISKDHIEKVPAPTVKQKSTIGAGDSMLAGMVLALSKDKSPAEVVRYGVASGTAATMNSGTELCKKEDADKLYSWLQSQ